MNNQLQITLSPHLLTETVDRIHVRVSVCQEGLDLLCFPASGFSGRIPFATCQNLQCRDNEGPLSFAVSDMRDEGPLSYKKLKFERKVAGTLICSYDAYPRELPENYRSCPYFDFRSEELGATGSGLFLLILPEDKNQIYEVSTRWILDDLPRGYGAGFNFKEDIVADLKTIRFSFFMVGKMHRIASASADFRWLKDPAGFDMRALAEKTTSIFDAMKAYFNDSESTFTIFIRRDPFPLSGGGTACPYAFISGYSTQGTTDIRRWENVLVHEMAHTWLKMGASVSGFPLTWFIEGSVEYYSAFVPYRAGFYDKEYMCWLINNKATERYYSKKYRTCSEKEIAEIQWKDMEAQTVPYGKGFMYLSLIDYKLRRKNRSLDSIIIGKYHCQLTEQNWLDFIEEEFGPDGIREYYDMLNGKLIVPPEDIFEGFCCEAFETDIDGQTSLSYRWKPADD